MLKRMTPKDYSEFWERESTQFARDNVYARLSQHIPEQPTLEVGCGAGWSTLSLAATRPVLAVDNNADLIDLARARLNEHKVSAQIIQSDLFEPSLELLSAIQAFQPKVVVGWFIGSHPDDNDKRTPANLRAEEKPKVYREGVEDRLVALPLCPPSVEWVHTVQRAGIPPGITDAEVKEGMVKEYEKYMFNNTGFEVTDVQLLDWNQGAGKFPYTQTVRPDLPAGTPRPVIVSILARRTSNV